MAYYIRTGRSTDGQYYDSEDAAIKQVQIVIAQQKSAAGRLVTRRGEQIEFHEKDGVMFDVMWVEDEEGKSVHVPIP